MRRVAPALCAGGVRSTLLLAGRVRSPYNVAGLCCEGLKLALRPAEIFEFCVKIVVAG